MYTLDLIPMDVCNIREQHYVAGGRYEEDGQSKKEIIIVLE